ncbi:MAG: hypothetical protein AAF596_07950 [Planctomycetota bacterium]
MNVINTALHAATNALIVAYLFYAWSWNLPEDRFLKRVANRIKAPFIWLGLWHAWSMFAPNPIAANRRIEAEIETAEGRRITWRAPTAAEQRPVAALWFARERKLYEFLEGKSFPFLHGAVCRHLVGQHRRDGSTPIAVTLVSVRTPITFPPASTAASPNPPDNAPPRPERKLLGSMRSI